MTSNRHPGSLLKELDLDKKQFLGLIDTARHLKAAKALGAEGVTEAAGKLQDAGLIHYRRGQISVLDRPGLEARACECYQVVKTEFDRLLPYVVK